MSTGRTPRLDLPVATSGMAIDMPRPPISESYSTVHHATYLVDYWRMVLKYRWLIVASTVIVATLVSIISFRMTPMYEAVGRIAIYKESADSFALNPQKFEPEEDWDSSIDLDTQVRVLQSDNVAMQVIKNMDLGNNPAFLGVKRRPAPPAPGGLAPNADDSREAVLLGRFHKALKVSVIPRTRVVEIRFLSADPRLSAQIERALRPERD